MTDNRKQSRKAPQFFIGVYDKEETRQVGRVANISSSGLMVIGKSELTRYQDYNISLELPEKINEQSRIIFSAQCRWCERGGRTNLYSCGLEIIEITDTNLELLKKLLEHPETNDESGVSSISALIES